MALLNRYVDATLGMDTGTNGSAAGSSAWATLDYALDQISGYSSGDTVDLYCANGVDGADTVNTWPTLAIDAYRIIGDIPQDGTYTGYDASLYVCQDVNFINQGTTFCPVTLLTCQFRTNKSTGISYAFTISDTASNAMTIEQCYIAVAGASTSQAYGLRATSDTFTHNINRTIFEGENQTGSIGVYFQGDGINNFINNTLYGWATAESVSLGVASRRLENSVAFSNGADFFNSATNIFAADSNCSEDGYANDSNHVTTTQTGTQLFTDGANGDFTIPNTSSDLYANGKDVSADFTVDITGNTYTTDDIGAFAFVAAGGGTILPFFNHYMS